MRVAQLVSAMRVKFTTRITAFDANLGEVTDTGYLDVVRRLQEVRGLESSFGHEASAAARSRTVRDDNLFNLTNYAVRFWWSPHAEVAELRGG